MKRSSWCPIRILSLALLLAFPAATSTASVKETTRVESATEVMAKIMEIPEQRVVLVDHLDFLPGQDEIVSPVPAKRYCKKCRGRIRGKRRTGSQ